jgi:hypothetical protein
MEPTAGQLRILDFLRLKSIGRILTTMNVFHGFSHASADSGTHDRVDIGDLLGDGNHGGDGVNGSANGNGNHSGEYEWDSCRCTTAVGLSASALRRMRHSAHSPRSS